MRDVDFHRRLQHVEVLCGNAARRFGGEMVHERHHGQAKQQKQAAEHDAEEQRGKMRDVSDEHAQAEPRDEAQAFGKLHAGALRAVRDLAAQELERDSPHAAQKPDERYGEQEQKRHDGGHDEHVPVPSRVIRRKAVRVVVEPLHRQHEQRVTDDVAENRARQAHERGKRHVVRHQLALAPTAREQRADDGAFLFDGGIGQHDEHERHDHDEHGEQDLPHHLVAFDVVERIRHRLVSLVVDEIGDDFAFVGEDLHHALGQVGALDQRHLAVVEVIRVAVDERTLIDAVERFGRDLRRREAERVEDEARIVLEQTRVIGKRHDADERHRLAGELDLRAERKAVVLAEHAVERDFVGGFGRAPLRVNRLVALAAIRERARLRALGCPLEGERRVVVELLDHLAAERFDRVDRSVVGLEGGREVAVFGVVGLAHALPDELDRAGGHEETRREGDREREQQEHSQVLSQVVAQLAREAFGEGRCHATR